MKSGLHVATAWMTASLLSACVSGSPSPSAGGGVQSAGRSDPQAAAASDGIPSLPQNYKQVAAKHLVMGYMDDAIGPPEISDIEIDKRPLGASSRVIIRYPVSVETAAKTNFMARAGAGTYYRCGGVSAFRSISTLGETTVSTSVARVATTECNPNLKYTRYRELEDLATLCRNAPKDCGVVRTPLGGMLVYNR
ncbi:MULTISPECIES: hypothetical protein [Methylobacterium]|uniref:hypothetical protein n=1 Tax=Methylobacterium TaxID=407 RepID=UPI0013EB9099|nr:hypothetical protein [Methylobacterium sp. DB0501]NGM38839.1 hypothetical protein [Methylobacterium sp. DB0501]